LERCGRPARPGVWLAVAGRNSFKSLPESVNSASGVLASQTARQQAHATAAATPLGGFQAKHGR